VLDDLSLLQRLPDPALREVATPAEYRACRALWQAALATLLADAASRGTTREAKAARRDARAYLGTPTRDLALVLELAGLSWDAWPRALAALRARWAEADAGRRSAPTRPPLSAEARAKIAMAMRRHGRERAARRAEEAAAAA
jgi:hypothetical protein